MSKIRIIFSLPSFECGGSKLNDENGSGGGWDLNVQKTLVKEKEKWKTGDSTDKEMKY